MEPIEIEVKFCCPHPEKARTAVLEAGASSLGRAFEANTLYDRDGALEHGLCVLRLRRDDKCTLTYKEPIQGSDPEFKMLRELEVEVSGFHQMEQILEALGFLASRKYEKWRETFILGRTKLLLDALPFGAFLELEGDREDIMNMARLLGFDWKKRIVLNYMQMFEIVRKGEGVASRDLTFEAFQGLDIPPEKYAAAFQEGS